MARAVSTNRKLVFTVIGWGIGFLIFFPILWTFLTSFKSEGFTTGAHLTTAGSYSYWQAMPRMMPK